MLTYAKSNAAAIIATLADYLVLILCVQWVHLPVLWGTVLGVVFGGVINFGMGRTWVFHAGEGAINIQAWRYLLVWGGNFLLCVTGVYWLSRQGMEYVIAKVIVSVLLGLTYNYFLQKWFVFRDPGAREQPLRDRLQRGIYVVIDPFVRGLIKIGFTPNTVTTIGFVLNVGVAVIFLVGAEEGNRSDFSYVGWAGGLILFAGLFDMLDGQVARLGNMSSRFGALFDSVLDRYSELVMFLGICFYLVAQHYFLSSLLAFLALIGSMMVSYTRARSEGLGIQNKGGLMQRPERVVLVGVSAVACGITSRYIGGDFRWYVKGIPFHLFETMSVFTAPLAVMAVLTNVTALRRLRAAKKALEALEEKK